MRRREKKRDLKSEEQLGNYDNFFSLFYIHTAIYFYITIAWQESRKKT